MIKSGDQVILIGGENKIDGQQIKNIEARDQRIEKNVELASVMIFYKSLRH